MPGLALKLKSLRIGGTLGLTFVWGILWRAPPLGIPPGLTACPIFVAVDYGAVRKLSKLLAIISVLYTDK